MMIDKEQLLLYLLQKFYEAMLGSDKGNSDEYFKGYRKGMLDIIEAINFYESK